jgi:hypothetical protein
MRSISSIISISGIEKEGGMFRIDHVTNRISKLEAVTFSDLGFTERNHLQEWLANQPDALGEELLIIQKEFDGFDETRERLDLLALDKQGALVIIENKLDDSGRDVVWQSLKYASYCSTLSKSNIAEIYQRYLDRTEAGKDARALICEFLGEEDFGEVVLNSGNGQRVVMVAAQFRKEVTSTVLWLLGYKIPITCFRATPYRDGEALFLNIEQVIPLPEAEEFMIGMSEKEAEEQSSERGQASRHQLRTEFWLLALEKLKQSGVHLFGNVGASKDHWLNAGSGLSGAHYSMIFTRDAARVEFVLDRVSKDQNKAMFDALFSRKEELEGRFGAPFEWRRNDDKKVSIISYGQSFEGHDRETWPEIAMWLVDHVQKLEKTFSLEIPELRAVLRRAGLT